jgi:hypothetical protein
VLSTGLAKYARKRISAEEASRLQIGLQRLLETQAFHDAISFATTRPDNVSTRFERTERMLRRVLGAP